MASHVPLSSQLRDLTRQLMLEYRGALPPGQVLVTVRDANRILGRSIDPGRRLVACEGIARRVLTERIAALAVDQQLERIA